MSSKHHPIISFPIDVIQSNSPYKIHLTVYTHNLNSDVVAADAAQLEIMTSFVVFSDSSKTSLTFP